MVDKIDFSEVHNLGGYGSEFDSEAESSKKRSDEFKGLEKKRKRTTDGVTSKRYVEEEYTKEEGKIQRQHFLSLDAYARHKQFVNNYLLYYGGKATDFKRDSSKDKRDIDVIRENHQFLWDEDDNSDSTWEKRLAKKYYDKLFKEYCIADLSRYKENKFGMRWRVEKEVFEGKGQFICGSKKCNEKEGLKSWEVNFGYIEQGEKKNALVKLRLCPDCSYKLNYHHKKKEILPKKSKYRKDEKKSKKQKRHEKKHKRDRYDDSKSDKNSHSEEEEEEEVEEDSSNKDKESEDAEESVWSGPVKLTEEKSREEEFDAFFEEMFL